MNIRTIDISRWESRKPAPQPVPQVQWVALADLVIDDAYQRPIGKHNIAAITKIADNFNWAMFSPLIVAPSEGGKYAVIDGQHRAHAAAICGFSSVPAMVTTISLADQAAAFAKINTGQIRASTHQVYRARLAAGDALALAMRDAVAAAGCKLMTYQKTANARLAGEVFCVQLIEVMVKKDQARAVTLGLAALRTVNRDDVAQFDAMLLNPWLGAVAQSPKYQNLNMLCDALRANKPWMVIEKANRQSGGKGGVLERRNAFVKIFADQIGLVRK